MKKTMFVSIAAIFVIAAVSAYAGCGGCSSNAKADISKGNQTKAAAAKAAKSDAIAIVCSMVKTDGHVCDDACKTMLKTKSSAAACCDVNSPNALCSPSCAMIQKSTAKKASAAKHICDAGCANCCMLMSKPSLKDTDTASPKTIKKTKEIKKFKTSDTKTKSKS
ncbi:MAG: hypothetical protein J7K40_07915 [candidate division Zixibacteria bacterium]|nr:hypothetical protein [candidate division Zixibacteria bacterium]